ncbi:MAG: transposase [Aquabacterium sp.]
MARLPRLGVAGWPHLVVQRVHDGQLLARDDQDRQAILEALRDAARQHGLAIHAYALAPDHLHLLATPQSDDALSLVMQALGRRYVAAYNRRHGRQGGLWSGRYRATVLEPAQYLLDAMVFIEQHAVRAGQAFEVDEDACCSVRHHLGLRTDPLIADHALFWALGNTPFEREAAWRRRLEAGLSGDGLLAMAEAVHKGWALMPEAAAVKLAVAAGRRLTPRPRGRPRKAV